MRDLIKHFIRPVLLVCLVSSEGYACVCGEGDTIQQKYQTARAVFLGTVQAKMKAYLFGEEGVLVVFRVETVWKGDVPRQLEVFTGPTADLYPFFEDCAPQFSLSERYLVFAHGVYGGTLVTDVCSGTSAFRYAEEEILNLGQGGIPAEGRGSPPRIPDDRPDIFGRVTSQSGGPLPGATVTLVKGGVTLATGSFDDGNYSLHNILNGRYTLTFSFPGCHSVTQEVELRFPDRTRVDAILNWDRSIPDQSSSASTAVTVFVADDSTGKGIANAEVTVNGWTMIADSYGRAAIVVPAGRFSVEARKSGYVFAKREIEDATSGDLHVDLRLSPVK